MNEPKLTCEGLDCGGHSVGYILAWSHYYHRRGFSIKRWLLLQFWRIKEPDND